MSGPFGSSQWMYNAGGGLYGYEIEGSLRFDNDAASRLTRTVTHNRKTFTINFWVKRANLGRYWLYGVYSNGANTANLNFEADGTLVFYDYLSAYRFRLVTTRVFRDVAWYCITLSVDTTQSTASDRVKIFVNGVQETSFSTATYPSQNLDLKFGGGETHAIGTEGTNSRLWFDGHLANWALVADQQLDASSFGEMKSGIWTPKDITGLTYGTGGYLLEFAGNTNDTSGNGNHWTATNINSWDYGQDSPTNNFNIGLPIDKSGPGNIIEAGLRSYVTAQGNYFSVGTSMAVKGGKWYYECRPIRGGNNSSGLPDQRLLEEGRYCNSDSAPTGRIAMNIGTADGSDGVYMVAMDLDNGYIYRGRNGSWSNGATAAGISSGSGTGAVATLSAAQREQYLRLVVTHRHDTGTSNLLWNFGQDSTLENYTTAGGNSDENGYGDFKYPVPNNFFAMCSRNMPDPAINPAAGETPEDYFNTVIYTGNNTSSQSVTNVGFQPSLVVAKSRPANSGFNWIDAVRGATKNLQSSSTLAEATVNTVTSFDSDGFTVGDGNGYDINKSGESIVAWNWKAGGAAVSNTDGSITSTVSANPDAGFSIVTYSGNSTSGATVGHGLNAVPKMIIVMTRSGSNNKDKPVYHAGIGNTGALILNSTGGTTTWSGFWNNTTPISTVFTLGSDQNTNQSGSNYVAYCFANVDGMVSCGSYVGNGSADGASVVSLNFRPAWVMIKNVNVSSHHWTIYDNKRGPHNPIDPFIYANSTSPEGNTGDQIDFLSNGFKARKNDWNLNASGVTYIYLAVAEQSAKFSNAR